jgi:mycofactocin precursor
VEGESAERIRSFEMENPAVSLDETHDELAEESLIEEVSIDGMCGVY